MQPLILYSWLLSQTSEMSSTYLSQSMFPPRQDKDVSYYYCVKLCLSIWKLFLVPWCPIVGNFVNVPKCFELINFGVMFINPRKYPPTKISQLLIIVWCFFRIANKSCWSFSSYAHHILSTGVTHNIWEQDELGNLEYKQTCQCHFRVGLLGKFVLQNDCTVHLWCIGYTLEPCWCNERPCIPVDNPNMTKSTSWCCAQYFKPTDLPDMEGR